MDLDRPLAERPDPILRVAVQHDIPDVEPRLDPWALKFVDVLRHLERAEQELVPNLLDGNHHSQLLGQRQELANLRLRARPGVAIGGLWIHDGGNEQHRIGAPQLGVLE